MLEIVVASVLYPYEANERQFEARTRTDKLEEALEIYF